MQNKYLLQLYIISDRDSALNQLLEYLHQWDHDFIKSLHEKPEKFELLDSQEVVFLIQATAILDYKLQEMNLPIPMWIRDKHYRFKQPVAYSRLFYHKTVEDALQDSPEAFKSRNIYFDINGLHRV